MSMGNWQPWVYPAHWSVDEHNAVLAELRKAEAEVERMGTANNEACDRIAEMERENAEHRRHVSTAMSREADTLRRCDSLADYCITADKRIAELEAQLAAVPRVDPEALEALAKMHFEHRRAANSEWEVMSWEEHERDHPERHREYLDATAAILRAAQPRVNMEPDTLYPVGEAAWLQLDQEAIDWINRRIRYSVELPEPSSNAGQLPAAPTDAQIEALARKLNIDCGHFPFEEIRDYRIAQARAAYAHIGAELAAVTAERDKLLQSKERWMDIAGKVVTERDALRAELAARATRPVKVRFNVTPQELAWQFAPIHTSTVEVAVAKLCMDYLADHAVIDLPPGVPSLAGEANT